MSQTSGSSSNGNTTGPASSTDNALVRFDGTVGKTLQDSGWTLSDANVLAGVELTLSTPLGVTEGGTGGGDAGTARTNLGVAIGSDVLAYDAGLTSISSLGSASDKFLYTTGIDTYAEGSITSTGRSILDDSTSSAMRTTLGIAIGSDVQGFDSALSDISSLAKTDGNFIVANGTNFVAESGSTARTSLGLGSLALSSSVSESDWSGTDLSVANGGTGVSSNTAYAVLCGGTSTTGAHQSIAGLGSSGQVLTSNGAGALPTFQDASGGGVETASKWGYTTGLYYSPGHMNRGGTALSGAAADRIVLIPMEIGDDINIVSINCQVNFSHASNARLVIYNNDTGGDELPTTVNKDGGTVSCSTSGVKSASFTSYALSAGKYWLGIHFEGSPQMYGVTTSGPCAILPRSSTATLVPEHCVYVDGNSYASGAPDLTASSPTYSSIGTFIWLEIA